MTTENNSEPSDEQLHRIVYSIWDFQQALSALTFLMEDCDLEAKYSKVELRRFRCYETQAILSFCRPFAASKSGVQLSCKSAGLTLNAEERAFKKHVIDLIRNQTIAHSDCREMHYKGITLEIGGDSSFRAPFFLFDEGLSLSNVQRNLLESLLHKLIQGLTMFTFSLCESNPDRFDIYKLPISMSKTQV